MQPTRNPQMQSPWRCAKGACIVAISAYNRYAIGNDDPVDSALKIDIATRALAKLLNSERELSKKYGQRMSKVIARRLAVLRNAPNLAAVPTHKPERRHPLKGKRVGQQAVDLVHPHRLVFTPAHEPLPKHPHGSVDEEQVTAIRIIEVVDYH